MASRINVLLLRAADIFARDSADIFLPLFQPALFGIVPADKAIIPVSLWFYVEAFGSNAQAELNAVIGTGGSYTSGMTSRTAVCTRSDITGGSGVTWYQGDNSTVVVGSHSQQKPLVVPASPPAHPATSA
mgnify:CR=1 FL=1